MSLRLSADPISRCDFFLLTRLLNLSQMAEMGTTFLWWVKEWIFNVHPGERVGEDVFSSCGLLTRERSNAGVAIIVPVGWVFVKTKLVVGLLGN